MIESGKLTLNIVEKAIQGDKIAFGELYEIHFDAIFRYVYRRTGDIPTAEDLAEEVFVKSWESIGRLAKPEAFVAWLYTIARNKLTDYYRTAPSARQVPLEDALEIADPRKLADTFDDSVKEVAQLKKALTKLPVAYKEILELRFFQDLDTPEIAKVLQKNAGAVRILQLRALKRLKELMKEV